MAILDRTRTQPRKFRRVAQSALVALFGSTEAKVANAPPDGTADEPTAGAGTGDAIGDTAGDTTGHTTGRHGWGHGWDASSAGNGGGNGGGNAAGDQPGTA